MKEMSNAWFQESSDWKLCHDGACHVYFHELIYCFRHFLGHRFSKCSVRSPRAPREKPRGSASYSFTY